MVIYSDGQTYTLKKMYSIFNKLLQYVYTTYTADVKTRMEISRVKYYSITVQYSITVLTY